MTSNNIIDTLLDTIQILIDKSQATAKKEIDELLAQQKAEEYLLEPIPVGNPIESLISIETKVFNTLENAEEEYQKFDWNLFKKASLYDRFNLEFIYNDKSGDIYNPYGFEVLMGGSNGITLLTWDSSKDVLGNPYFPSMIYKKSYDISNMLDLSFVQIKFYGPVKLTNVKFSLGFETTKYAAVNNEAFKIYGIDNDLSYTEIGQIHELSTQWIYNTSPDTFGAITALNYSNAGKAEEALRQQKATLYWYEYDKTYKGVDEYLGTQWRKVNIATNKLNYSFVATEQDIENARAQIRAVIVQNITNSEKPTIFKSNIIVIENKTEKKDYGNLRNASIYFTDGTNGVYSLYDYDNYLVSSEWYQCAVSRIAQMKFSVDGISSQELPSCIKKIVWQVPVTNLIVDNKDQFWDKETKAGYVTYTKIADFVENDYVLKYKIPRLMEKETEVTNLYCEIVLKDGRAFKAEHEIKFSHKIFDKQIYRVISRLFNMDGSIVENQAFLENGEEEHETKVKIFVFDPSGKEIQLTDDNKQDITPTGQSFTTYQILLDTVTLYHHYAFPSCSNKNYYYQGPTEVVYDSTGTNLTYNNAPCQLINIEESDSVPGGTWQLKPSGETSAQAIIGFNSYKNIILPRNAYLPNMSQTEVRVEYTFGNNNYWSQPIIIRQDTHFSSIIDQWDGALTIDQDNNCILASAYVAGSKNNEGNFTGAILGDLGTIADNNAQKTESGLFGYQAGIQSFAFKTDGTAFLGKAGGGRINFDGNGGLIQSGNYKAVSKKDYNGVGGEYEGKANYELTLSFLPDEWNGRTGICTLSGLRPSIFSLQYTYHILGQDKYILTKVETNPAETNFTLRIDKDHKTLFLVNGPSPLINPYGDEIIIPANTEISFFQSSTIGYAQEGMLINIQHGEIHSKNFYLDSSGNVSMRGIIDAEAGGNLGGFYIGTNYLGNANSINNITYGLLGAMTPYVGYEKIQLGTTNNIIQVSGTSPLVFFAGEKLESNNDGNNIQQTKLPFYITQSGFVKANHFYSTNAIVNNTDNYQSGLWQGQLNIIEKDTIINQAIYHIHGMQWERNYSDQKIKRTASLIFERIPNSELPSRVTLRGGLSSIPTYTETTDNEIQENKNYYIQDENGTYIKAEEITEDFPDGYYEEDIASSIPSNLNTRCDLEVQGQIQGSRIESSVLSVGNRFIINTNTEWNLPTDIGEGDVSHRDLDIGEVIIYDSEKKENVKYILAWRFQSASEGALIIRKSEKG